MAKSRIVRSRHAANASNPTFPTNGIGATDRPEAEHDYVPLNAPLRRGTAVAMALGDPTRVRILLALRNQELCVCQILALFRLAPSTVSKHLSVLRQCDLIDVRKRGRWMYYRRSPAATNTPGVREIVAWADQWFGDDPRVESDRQRLTQILRSTPEELCRAPSRE